MLEIFRSPTSRRNCTKLTLPSKVKMRRSDAQCTNRANTHANDNTRKQTWFETLLRTPKTARLRNTSSLALGSSLLQVKSLLILYLRVRSHLGSREHTRHNTIGSPCTLTPVFGGLSNFSTTLVPRSGHGKSCSAGCAVCFVCG